MARKNNNNLFFTCSLIEYMGRKVKRTRREVVRISWEATGEAYL